MTAAMLAGFFSVFGFGVLLAFLGSIKLKLTPRIGADDEQFGRIVSVFQWTMVFMAIIGGIALDGLGHGIIIPLGMLLSALAVLLIAGAGSIGAVMGACVLMGIGGQFLNLGGNTLLPNLFADPSAGSNLGNTFFGLGALLVPIITAAVFVRGGYSKALYAVAVILVIPIAFAVAGSYPPVQESFRPGLAVELLAQAVTWASALTLFCYIGLEVSMSTWITTYASQLGAGEVSASRMLSLFYVAMMLSRLGFGLQDYVTGIDLTPVGGYVLVGAALAAAIILSVMIATRSLGVARWAIILAGAVFGPIFPTTVGVTFQHFDASQWGTLFGVIFAIGLIGASTLPAWIGKMAKGKTVQGALNILRVTAVVLAVLAGLLSMA